jgi:hypothetical protein
MEAYFPNFQNALPYFPTASLNRRIPDKETLCKEVAARQASRNNKTNQSELALHNRRRPHQA